MTEGANEDGDDGDEKGKVHAYVIHYEDFQFQQRYFKFLVVRPIVPLFVHGWPLAFYLNEISFSFASIVFYLNLNK